MVKIKRTPEELVDIYYKNKAMSKGIKRVQQKKEYEENRRLVEKERRENKGLIRTGKIVSGIVPGRGYEEERTQAIRRFVKPTNRLSSKSERKLLRETKEKMKDIAKKRSKDIKEKRIRASKYRRESIKGAFKSREKRKNVSRRARGTSNVLKAFGVVQGSASKSGAGRPRGTFKYGNMPIHVYKKMMRDKKAQYQMYQQEQAMKLKSRGFSPEQLQQLQQQQTIAEMQQPIQEQQYEEQYEETPREYEQQMPQQVQQQYQQPMPSQGQRYGRVIPRSQQIRPGRSVADDELEFRQWSAEKTISPRTQRVLDTIRRIQNKGKTDNIEQQRRNRERNMVGRSMNLLKAHENMINTKMDFTGVDSDENILMAENIWKTNPNNNIMRTNRSNILSGENNLKFF